MFKIDHWNQGMNESLRSDLLSDNELQLMKNSYQENIGVIIPDTLPVNWTEFNYLNLQNPKNFYIWTPAKNLNNNSNDWIIICVSGNHIFCVYQNQNNIFQKIEFTGIEVNNPTYANHNNLLFIADNNLKSIYTIKNENNELVLNPYTLESPKGLISISPASIDNEFVDNTDSNLGMNIPRGSILQYCYTIVDQNNYESNPSPVQSYDALNFIEFNKVWKKTKLTFPDLPINAKYYRLYRRDNLYSESKAFSNFSFISKVYGNSFIDSFPSIEFIEPQYDHDFNIKADQIAVSNNRIFLANATRNNMFPFNFDKYIKIDIINNNTKNYINAWIRIDLTSFPELNNALSNTNKRLYDTDRITPLQAMLSNNTLFVRIPYLQAGLNHLIFLAYDGISTITNEYNTFEYGLIGSIDFSKIRQTVKNENVVFSWHNRYWNGLNRILSDSNGEKTWSLNPEFSDQVITNIINNSIYTNSTKFFSGGFEYIFEKRRTTYVTFASELKNYKTSENQIFRIGLQYFNQLNEQLNQNLIRIIKTETSFNDTDYFKILLNDQEVIFNGLTNSVIDHDNSILKIAVSYKFDNIIYNRMTLTAKVLLQFFPKSKTVNQYSLIEKTIDICTQIETSGFDFSSENLKTIVSHNNQIHHSKIYFEIDKYINNFSILRDLLNTFPIFEESYPGIIVSEIKTVQNDSENYLIYSDENGLYFPEANSVKLPTPIQKIIPDTNYKDNRINSVYLFSNFSVYHYELVNGTNQSFNVITDKNKFYHFHEQGIIPIDNEIFFIDQYGIRSFNQSYISGKINKNRFIKNMILSFDPSKNRLALFDIQKNEMIFINPDGSINISDSFENLKNMIPFKDKLLCIYENTVKLYPSDQKAIPEIKTKKYVSNKKFRIKRIKINGSGSIPGISIDNSNTIDSAKSTNTYLINDLNKWQALGLMNVCKEFEIKINNFDTLESIEIDLLERG